MSLGRIVQISVSPGGVPKRAVAAARVGTEGLEGDGHRDTEHHGGPERAICLFALEHIQALEAEGHRAFRDGHYARVSQKRHPGWSRVYARVLAPGTIKTGDPVHLLPR